MVSLIDTGKISLVAAAFSLALGAATFAFGPRGNPPSPVSATWDATSGSLTIVFDAALHVDEWPPLPIKGAFTVTAGAQHWYIAQTVEIGGTPSEPNRHLLIVFSDPVSADPPADGALCAYSGTFLRGDGGAVQRFTDFPCAQ